MRGQPPRGARARFKQVLGGFGGARATRLRLRSWFEGLRERLGGDGAPAVDKEIRFPETDLRRQ